MSATRALPEYKVVPLGLIDPPELPSRSEMDEHKLDELVVNIRENGVLNPLSLARVGERYRVIAGHRRYLASGRAGLAAVPAMVYPEGTTTLARIQHGENRHREELGAADEAIWFSELLEQECGGDVDRLCEHVGEKRAYVEGRLILFQGDERVFQALRDGRISIGVAHQLNKCTDELRRRSLLHSAIHGGATVAVVAGWIEDWRREVALTPGGAPAAPTTSTPAAIPQTDYFRCAVCQKSDNVHLMQPVNVHTHCKMAILDPLLETYHGADALDGTGRDARRT